MDRLNYTLAVHGDRSGKQ